MNHLWGKTPTPGMLLWLADLAETKAPQATERLAKTREGEVGYCCLGRACEVARLNKLTDMYWYAGGLYLGKSEEGDGPYRFEIGLPDVVMDWLGGNGDASGDEGSFHVRVIAIERVFEGVTRYHYVNKDVQTLNDADKLSFVEIGEAIKANLARTWYVIDGPMKGKVLNAKEAEVLVGMPDASYGETLP